MGTPAYEGCYKRCGFCKLYNRMKKSLIVAHLNAKNHMIADSSNQVGHCIKDWDINNSYMGTFQ